MAKRDKLKERLLSGNQDKNFGFDDLCMLVLHLGFTERPAKGSHRVFYRQGIDDIINLQPARDGKAKPYQVKQIREIVKAYDL